MDDNFCSSSDLTEIAAEDSSYYSMAQAFLSWSVYAAAYSAAYYMNLPNDRAFAWAYLPFDCPVTKAAVTEYEF